MGFDCGVGEILDILELLKPYFYQQIHMDKNSQSCKAVLLDGCSAVRCIEQLNGQKYRDQYLSVSLASCDFMLCITQLPLSFTHSQFVNLITPFGTPERCFLVYSEATDESKGYGCVEFTSKESSIKAKNQLNGYQINNNILQVHWLDSIPDAYSGLSSKCLLVEELPIGINDNTKLKQLFSYFAVPSFCQVAGCSSGQFAVVEYQNPIDCEKTWRYLNGFSCGSSLKVSFCVPGPCGLVVLNSIKASRDLKSANPAGGLLPTPKPSESNIMPSLHHSIVQNNLIKDVQKSQLLKQFSIPICAGNSSKVDDEVFELVNKCKEDPQSFFHLQHDIRSTNSFDPTQHFHQSSLSATTFLREDSLRSESSDSAYGGSQGSNSDLHVQLPSEPYANNSAVDPKRDVAAIHSRLAGPGAQCLVNRYPIYNHESAEDRLHEGELLHYSNGRFSPYRLHSTKMQMLTGNMMKPISKAMVAEPCASTLTTLEKSIQDDSELLRLVPTTRTSSASLAELGKDSPTQLRLLGHNLMEGLLGDSPPSSDDAGRERLINALNLLSPTNHATLSSTPTSTRRRHLIPSPEPSPEAGAYVGQHSQGLGGHYADSSHRLHAVGFPSYNQMSMRRRSNEI